MHADGPGCACRLFIGIRNECFWVATQCEVWTKCKKRRKPYGSFGMNILITTKHIATDKHE